MKLSHELETAIRAAKTAGDIQLKNFGKPIKKTMKGTKDFATNVDFECEKTIITILQKEFFDYGILTEEQSELQSDSDYRWIVDPLDGTIWYSLGLPRFGVFIALEKKQELQLGLIYQPFQKELLTAQKNRGTFLNNQRIRVSQRNNLEEALLGYAGIRFQLQYHQAGLQKLIETVYWQTGITALQGIKYLCNGTLDILLNSGKTSVMKRWDTAAKKIVIEEAGGIYSNYQGEIELEKINGALATNQHLHKQAIKILNEKRGNA